MILRITLAQLTSSISFSFAENEPDRWLEFWECCYLNELDHLDKTTELKKKKSKNQARQNLFLFLFSSFVELVSFMPFVSASPSFIPACAEL